MKIAICTYKKGKLVPFKGAKVVKTVQEAIAEADKLSIDNPGVAFVCLDDNKQPFFDALKAKSKDE